MKKIITILLSIMFLTTLVSAFGVSSPYWSSNPLSAARGETTTVNLNLQNMVGDEDVTVRAEIVSGDELVSLDKEVYTVAAGTSDAIAPLEISIPKDAQVGSTEKIRVEFKTVADGDGMVVMGTGMSIGFDVNVIEEVKDNSALKTTIIAILAILILAVGTVLIRTKKELQ